MNGGPVRRDIEDAWKCKWYGCPLESNGKCDHERHGTREDELGVSGVE